MKSRKQLPDYQRVRTQAIKKMYGKDYIPYQNKWQEYEQLKAEVRNKVLTPEEYESEIKKIVERLGL